MGLAKKANKFRKNLWKMGKADRDSFFHIVNTRGFKPKVIVRELSDEKARQEIQAISKKFPTLGKSLSKQSLTQQKFYLEQARSAGLQESEKAIKEGISLQDIATIHKGNWKDLQKASSTQTMNVLKKYDVSLQKAKIIALSLQANKLDNAQRTIEELGKRTITIGKGSKRRTYNLLQYLPSDAVTYCTFYFQDKPRETLAFMDVLQSKTTFSTDRFVEYIGLFSSLVKEHGLEKAVEIAKNNKVFYSARKKKVLARKRFFDLRRVGKKLYSRKILFSELVRTELAKKGIRLFPFSVAVKKVTTSSFNPKNRFVLYIEVPEIKNLKTIAKPKREHMRDSLAYVDFIIKTGSTGKKFISIQEVQSDIIGKLPQTLREKYSSFEELALLSIASYAESLGVEQITLSSANMIKKMWPTVSNQLLKRTYEDAPKKLGFQLAVSNQEFVNFEFAFAEPRLAYSNVWWVNETIYLKKQFPQFFNHTK